MPRIVEDSFTTNEVDVTGTLNMALAALDAGTQRVVLASFSSVCGRAQGLPKTESLMPQPISRYSVLRPVEEQNCMGLNAG